MKRLRFRIFVFTLLVVVATLMIRVSRPTGGDRYTHFGVIAFRNFARGVGGVTHVLRDGALNLRYGGLLVSVGLVMPDVASAAYRCTERI